MYPKNKVLPNQCRSVSVRMQQYSLLTFLLCCSFPIAASVSRPASSAASRSKRVASLVLTDRDASCAQRASRACACRVFSGRGCRVFSGRGLRVFSGNYFRISGGNGLHIYIYIYIYIHTYTYIHTCHYMMINVCKYVVQISA